MPIPPNIHYYVEMLSCETSLQHPADDDRLHIFVAWRYLHDASDDAMLQIEEPHRFGIKSNH